MASMAALKAPHLLYHGGIVIAIGVVYESSDAAGGVFWNATRRQEACRRPVAHLNSRRCRAAFFSGDQKEMKVNITAGRPLPSDREVLSYEHPVPGFPGGVILKGYWFFHSEKPPP